MRKPIFSCEVRRAFREGVAYESAEGAGIHTTFVETGKSENVRIVDATIENASEENFLGVIHLKVSLPQKNPKFFMPGYMYGRNTGEKPNHGRKEFPRIREGNCARPESEFWMTRSDRLAEPVSLIYDEGRIVGIAAPPYWVKGETGKEAVDLTGPEKKTKSWYQYAGFSCRLNDGGMASVGYTLGYENAPWLFIQSATVKERAPLTEENCFQLLAGESVRVTLRIYDYEADCELGVHKAIKDAYAAYYEAPRAIEGMEVRKAVEWLSGAIKEYAWLEDEGMYAGFVFDASEGYTYNKIGSLSWTNGLAVAVPMLLAANRLKDDKMREQALTWMEEVTAHSMNPLSGLPYDARNDGKWSVYGWWYDGMHSGGHSAYQTGQAVYYILKAYQSENRDRGVVHDDWMAFVKPVIEKVNQVKNSDGEYPFSMSEQTGAGLEYDSLGGAWCLTATALYCLISGEDSYLDGMRRSEQHYYDRFVRRVECYGGPLDTDKAVDNEGILAYIRAARLLHEMTEEKIYLEHLRDAIYYEVSFKLGYNTPVKVKPLCDIGWSSCGGSITSTANPHIHPMSSTVVDEMYYLMKYMPDEYVQKRLEDTVAWGLQTFNTKDGEYGYGHVGWMSERFCFCEGLVTEKYPDGTPAGTWFALMPWASASIIEGYVGEEWNRNM